MSQLPLLFLGCAPAPYLWTTSCTVTGVACCFPGLATTLFHNYPYRIPRSPPILTRVLIKHFAYIDTTFARSLQPRGASR
ncbi:hypothetical protein BDM02DRAFT_3121371 [Thelephora ganbajun]|uniref:Uncharacterized protein n=1 Tax=Thelephora ganbajun TaxID=370292 RepID=A0ACB6Z4S3_THEGA|nr:hypothetical protein BDM02DRAFT_3121371 [Thelephora ganbajun]